MLGIPLTWNSLLDSASLQSLAQQQPHPLLWQPRRPLPPRPPPPSGMTTPRSAPRTPSKSWCTKSSSRGPSVSGVGAASAGGGVGWGTEGLRDASSREREPQWAPPPCSALAVTPAPPPPPPAAEQRHLQLLYRRCRTADDLDKALKLTRLNYLARGELQQHKPFSHKTSQILIHVSGQWGRRGQEIAGWGMGFCPTAIAPPSRARTLSCSSIPSSVPPHPLPHPPAAASAQRGRPRGRPAGAAQRRRVWAQPRLL